MSNPIRVQRHLRSSHGARCAVAALPLLAGPAGAAELPVPPVSPPPAVSYEYDALENPSRITVAPGTLNLSTVLTYDAPGRLRDTTDPRQGKTHFGYDALDRTVRVTDPRNLVTQYVRNGLGDIRQIVSPDTGTATLTHDAAGNIATRTDGRGVVSTYAYDALNRLTSAVHTQGSASLGFGWSYDLTGGAYTYGVGRLGRVDHPAGNTQFAYDPQGRITQVAQTLHAAAGANAATVSSTVGYGYDAGGRLARITYPSGRMLTFTYADGRPVALDLAADAGGSQVMPVMSQIRWMPFGGRRSWQLHFTSGPLAYEQLRDLSGRLVRYPLGPLVRDLTYDAAGRITHFQHYNAATGAAEVALDQTFGYDENGRLINATSQAATRSFSYDGNGNRTSVTLGGSASGYTTATTSNRLASTSNPARSLAYDNSGNITSDSASHTATYDLAGRMATLTKAGITTTYNYDNLGQRVRKFSSSGAGSTVIFVYAPGGQLLGEYDSAGRALREYVWLGAEPVAVFTPDPANAAGPPLVYHIHADHLGTPRLVVDRNNAVRWRWLSEPFGTTVPETNPSGLGDFTFDLRMPGQYADAESGLFYNYFRSYDPTLGRYTQSDPIGLEGGVNTYTYVTNPISSADPSGLDACVVLFPDYPIEYAPGRSSTWLGGHAGVLTFDASGSTQYHEYGRYAPNSPGVIGARLAADSGNVRRVSVPNLQMDKNGSPTPASMNALRQALSQRAGRGTQAEVTCDAEAEEERVREHIRAIANNPNRREYSWNPLSANHCRTFANDAVDAGR